MLGTAPAIRMCWTRNLLCSAPWEDLTLGNFSQATAIWLQKTQSKEHCLSSSSEIHYFTFFFFSPSFFAEIQLQILLLTHTSSGKRWLLPWNIKQHIRLGPCQRLSCHWEYLETVWTDIVFSLLAFLNSFFSRHVITQEKNYPRAPCEANNRKQKADLDHIPQTVPSVKDAGSAVSFLTWNKSSHAVS